MAISIGEQSISMEDILSMVTDFDILFHYFGHIEFNTAINSPLRKDNHPSFSFYVSHGKVRYKDYATGDSGGIFDLLMAYWGESYSSVLHRIWRELISSPSFSNVDASIIKLRKSCIERAYKHPDTIMECKVREWRSYDLDYWSSYGITLEWLKWADVHPISHKIIIKDGKRWVFGADKYAYAYVERKEGKITLKIYQPFNKNGFKWANKHDSSVVSLWTKIPKYGEKVVICSSLKDALCLSANIGIPALSVQGEGYGMSNTAINELKRRYKEQYVAFDGDRPGRDDSRKFHAKTGFKIIDCPLIGLAKDWSDIYHYYGRETMLKEFSKALESAY